MVASFALFLYAVCLRNDDRPHMFVYTKLLLATHDSLHSLVVGRPRLPAPVMLQAVRPEGTQRLRGGDRQKYPADSDGSAGSAQHRLPEREAHGDVPVDGEGDEHPEPGV